MATYADTTPASSGEDPRIVEFLEIFRRLPREGKLQALALMDALDEEAETGRKATVQSVRRHASALGIEAGPIILAGLPNEEDAA